MNRGGGDARPGPVQEGGFDAVPGPMPTPVTSAGGGLSDNDRLERLAGKRPGSATAIVLVALVFVVLVAIAFVVMRG